MAKISVCIPSFNACATVIEAIESARDQDCPPDEIIVLDDCSDDGTSELLADYSKNRDWLMYKMNSERLGMTENWNACLKEAGNELVLILHGDDRLCPGALGILGAVMDADPVLGACFSLASFIDSEGRVIGGTSLPSDFPEPGRRCGKADILKALMVNHNSFITCDSALMRKSALARAGMFQPTYRQAVDLDMWFRIVENDPVVFLGERLIEYRISPAQATFRYHRLRTVRDDFIDLLRREIALLGVDPGTSGWEAAFSSFDSIIRKDGRLRFLNSLATFNFASAKSAVVDSGGFARVWEFSLPLKLAKLWGRALLRGMK